MRIVGGKHRSRKLGTPKSNAVRPTSDKVRAAVFNMLNARGLVVDAVVLDAFSGTGALGLEALSQGASFFTFIDKNKQSLEICKANITALQEDENSQTLFCDVTNIKEKSENIKSADLIFVDPPYHQNLVIKTLHALKEKNWLADDCMFVIETAKDETISSEMIEIISEKIYGDTRILLAEKVR